MEDDETSSNGAAAELVNVFSGFYVSTMFTKRSYFKLVLLSACLLVYHINKISNEPQLLDGDYKGLSLHLIVVISPLYLLNPVVLHTEALIPSAVYLEAV
ncbi:hypothetical protein BYT27DRAFT_7264702 [Phlegmacium glaucopus]|nr:hypothetical protein BYT27DRAFT_7264702 [Phlegmacium glaucopus]